jgi:hypothetical protein
VYAIAASVDPVAITARTGQVRLHGKGDQVRIVPRPARSFMTDRSPTTATKSGTP